MASSEISLFFQGFGNLEEGRDIGLGLSEEVEGKEKARENERKVKHRKTRQDDSEDEDEPSKKVRKSSGGKGGKSSLKASSSRSQK